MSLFQGRTFENTVLFRDIDRMEDVDRRRTVNAAIRGRAEQRGQRRWMMVLVMRARIDNELLCRVDRDGSVTIRTRR